MGTSIPDIFPTLRELASLLVVPSTGPRGVGPTISPMDDPLSGEASEGNAAGSPAPAATISGGQY